MKAIPLTTIERQQGGFTHKFIITESDLTVTTAATGQTLTLMALAIGMLVVRVAMKLPIPFADSADNANNTSTLSVGDTGSGTRYMSAVETNVNGTEILYKEGTGTLKAYTAADSLQAVFGATASGKNLAAYDTGEVHIFAQIVDLTQL